MLQSQQQTPLAVVTIHDACSAFSTNIFKFADDLKTLGIKYNIALVPFFNEKQDLKYHKAFKKLKIPKVLNWDSTRYPEQNIVNIVKDEKSFKRLIKQKPKIIRIALHPRDPHSALEEQKQMISQLKDLGYMMPTYGELIPKLQEANHFRRYKQ
jgi:hypothetical protein